MFLFLHPAAHELEQLKSWDGGGDLFHYVFFGLGLYICFG